MQLAYLKEKIKQNLKRSKEQKLLQLLHLVFNHK